MSIDLPTMAEQPLRVAFATTSPDGMLGADPDRPFHEAAFAATGAILAHEMWWDSHVEWESYDLVVVRSTWDYVERLCDYRKWLGRMRQLPNFHNPVPVIEWNIDKRYLGDLAAIGIPVVPTEVATTIDQARGLMEAHSERGTAQVVLKPTTSAGSRLTGRFRTEDPAALALARAILADGLAVMVQPAVASVATRGEVSAVVVAGELSHAFHKAPLLADDGARTSGDHDDHIAAGGLTESERRCVDQVVPAVAELLSARFGVEESLLMHFELYISQLNFA